MFEDPADYDRPVFKAADRRDLRLGPAGDEPGDCHCEQGLQQLAALLEYILSQPLVLEMLASEGLWALGVHPYPVAAAHHISAELDVVPGRDPATSNRQCYGLRE